MGIAKPYINKKISNNSFERIFREHTNEDELVWHRDKKDRTVKIIECNGWKFQEDNKLPIELHDGDIINIKAYEYHRIIKGKGSLVVHITEHETNKNRQQT